MIQIKRIYEPVGPEDGYRVLVDRIWPRGVSKKSAQLDAWMKDVTPSSNLRKWFGHDPERWEAFRLDYAIELKGTVQQNCLAELKSRSEDGNVTLLYAAKDDQHNHALVLLDVLTNT